MNKFSIIICTYNPDEGTIKRLFDAILNFKIGSPEYEVLIIDNNSSPQLEMLSSVRFFLSKCSSARIIVEKKPGLTAARIAGINTAKYDWIIFFDDDNEPAADYLQKAAFAVPNHPNTAAWGPAEVNVEFVGAYEPWLEDEKPLLQERNDTQTTIDCLPQWQNCYPFGTGLIIKKDVAVLYVQRVTQNKYTLSDRKGKSLASGGDVQMVLTAIEQGYSAGVIGGLRLNHLINTGKTTIRYLQKQQYGTASAYIVAHNQVFTDKPIQVKLVHNRQVFLTAYSCFRIYYKKNKKEHFRLLLAKKMGELNACVQASEKRSPLLLRLYEFLIDV